MKSAPSAYYFIEGYYKTYILHCEQNALFVIISDKLYGHTYLRSATEITHLFKERFLLMAIQLISETIAASEKPQWSKRSQFKTYYLY